MNREFYIDTPLGKLKVWAKHKIDNAVDFPGVYVDLVRDGMDDDMLACVEYDSCHDRLQTVVYQPAIDEPHEIVVHDLNETEL